MPKLSVRANAIKALESIQNGVSLSVLLPLLLDFCPQKDKGFLHQLVLGTLRQWHALARITESLTKYPPKNKKTLAAINLGLYQLFYMQTPSYAAIGETVGALKQLGVDKECHLVNALLRKTAKSPTKYQKMIQKNHSLPNYLAKIIKQDWADYYDKVGQGLRQPAPIFLRINRQKTTLLEYCEQLSVANIAFELVDLGIEDKSNKVGSSHQSICLTEAVKIAHLPNFNNGAVSVQDVHAQLAGILLVNLNFDKPIKILDACAAPAGKTAHLLELDGDGFHVERLTALDNDQARLDRAVQNLTRLGFINNKNLELICGDALSYHQKEFDVILLDAPCTATGVIRRHPDITLLRTKSDILQTVQLQAQILDNLWRSLAVGGYLLYVTCSILKDENERQIQNFMHKNTQARPVDFKLTLPNQIKQSVGYQCLPIDKGGGDGFYYALLQKVV